MALSTSASSVDSGICYVVEALHRAGSGRRAPRPRSSQERELRAPAFSAWSGDKECAEGGDQTTVSDGTTIHSASTIAKGEPCLRPGCHGTIRRIIQGGGRHLLSCVSEVTRALASAKRALRLASPAAIKITFQLSTESALHAANAILRFPLTSYRMAHNPPTCHGVSAPIWSDASSHRNAARMPCRVSEAQTIDRVIIGALEGNGDCNRPQRNVSERREIFRHRRARKDHQPEVVAAILNSRSRRCRSAHHLEGLPGVRSVLGVMVRPTQSFGPIFAIDRSQSALAR